MTFKITKLVIIPYKHNQKSAPIIVPIPVATCNHCMRRGIFPDTLKIGKITPILKKGDTLELQNYRPVSTLPIFGKIFGKVIYESSAIWIQERPLDQPCFKLLY